MANDRSTAHGSDPGSTPAVVGTIPGAGDTDLAQGFSTQLSAALGSGAASVATSLLQRLGGNPQLAAATTKETVRKLIAEIDATVSRQVNHILHDNEFQRLESAWRGLYFVVKNAPENRSLRIRVMNISKEELRANLTASLYLDMGEETDNLARSPLYKKLFDNAFNMQGAYPYACVIGDYYFDHGEEDVDLLKQLGKLGDCTHAPFIAGASPELFGLESWAEYSTKHDVTDKLDRSDSYSHWRSLRDQEYSRYVALSLPRFLDPSRPLWTPRNTEKFAFREETQGKAENMIWLNSACAMGLNIMRSFHDYGVASAIRGYDTGGLLTDLKFYDLSGIGRSGPLEIKIDNDRAMKFENNGFIPVLPNSEQDPTQAVVIGAQTVQKPKQYQEAEASASAQLMARLSYMFICCRFVHVFQVMGYRMIGKPGMTPERLQTELNEWIKKNFCSPKDSQPEIMAERPLEEAFVEVEERADNPGYFRCHIYLKPHPQFEGMQAKVSMVSRIKSA